MQKFDYNQVTCLHPKVVRNPYTNELISVPCGKCSSCLTKKSLLWTTRCQEESTCHTYCLFGTLTYSDSHLTYRNVYDLDDCFYTDSFIKSLDSSLDYLRFCDNKIPCLNVKDVQLFFKRLRSKINYYHGKDTKIRYYLSGQYGPTTYRPHYHYLIWFDSDELSKVIKKYIFEAWQSFTDFTSAKKFFGRNKTRFVHGYVERYVAGYINHVANLPAVLNEKPFRQFHVQSNTPPIGTIRFLKQSLQGLLSGNFDKIVLHKTTSGSSVLLPLWRGLENRFFPKCVGYAHVDTYGREALYGLFSQFSSVFGGSEYRCYDLSFENFFMWIHSESQKANYGFQLFKNFCSETDEDSKSYKESLHRLFNISRQVFRLSQECCVSLSLYVRAIEEYYLRKEYDCLVIQMRFQELMSNSPRNDVDLRYYPMIVDSLFYENKRDLVSYQDYLHQFNLVEYDPVFFVPQFSVPYLQKKFSADYFVEKQTKSELNKDYIANHPECFQNYKSLLRPLSLTL